MIFSWQEKQWQQLMTSQQAGRLPHALLFAGSRGTGKVHFTRCFLHRLLCQQTAVPSNSGCSLNVWAMARRTQSDCALLAQTLREQPELEGTAGQQNAVHNIDCHAAKKKSPCHACRLVTQNVHPNVLWIEPEKKGQAIKIDQIRQVSEFTHQSALEDKYCIVVIHPANNMNINSANALLKTLEEPPPGCLLILISDEISRLPATVLSRCQRIAFNIPEKNEALFWLQSQLVDFPHPPALLLHIAYGAPLAALDLAQTDIMTERQTVLNILCDLHQNKEGPLQAALSVQDMDLLALIDMVYSWLMDVVRLQLGTTQIVNLDYQTQLENAANTMSNQETLQFITYLQRTRGQISQGSHLNKQLTIENIFIRYLKISLA